MRIWAFSDRSEIVVKSPFSSDPKFADIIYPRNRHEFVDVQIKRAVTDTLIEHWGQDPVGKKRDVWWNKTEYRVTVLKGTHRGEYHVMVDAT